MQKNKIVTKLILTSRGHFQKKIGFGSADILHSGTGYVEIAVFVPCRFQSRFQSWLKSRFCAHAHENTPFESCQNVTLLEGRECPQRRAATATRPPVRSMKQTSQQQQQQQQYWRHNTDSRSSSKLLRLRRTSLNTVDICRLRYRRRLCACVAGNVPIPDYRRPRVAGLSPLEGPPRIARPLRPLWHQITGYGPANGDRIIYLRREASVRTCQNGALPGDGWNEGRRGCVVCVDGVDFLDGGRAGYCRLSLGK